VSAILVSPIFSRIFQYLQYWYNQYFPESSGICNTGITSIFQNLPVSVILHGIGALLKYLDNMKQPAAILVLPVLYTILVLPVFYQNLPVSAILVQILVNTSIPVIYSGFLSELILW
jgi:hypothetical protein